MCCASLLETVNLGKCGPSVNQLVKDFTILLSSSTCMFGGQFFQLCRQQTIRSHWVGSWPCFLNWRLSYSNSMRKCCQRPGSTSILASQSGNPPCTDSITNPNCWASML